MLKKGGVLSYSTWGHQEWHTRIQPILQAIGAPDLPSSASMFSKTGQWDSAKFCERQLANLGFVECKSQAYTFQTGGLSMDAFMALIGMILPLFARGWPGEDKANKLPLVLPAYKAALVKDFGEGLVLMEMTAVLTTGVKGG